MEVIGIIILVPILWFIITGRAAKYIGEPMVNFFESMDVDKNKKDDGSMK
jgi:riboflavin transporter FmnP